MSLRTLDYLNRAEQYRPTDTEAIAGEIRRLAAANLKPRDISQALGLHIQSVFDALRDVAQGAAPTPYDRRKYMTATPICTVIRLPQFLGGVHLMKKLFKTFVLLLPLLAATAVFGGTGGVGSIVICHSGAAVTHTGDTAETNLAVCPISANMLGPNGMLEIRVFWQYTNNADTKTTKIRFSATLGDTSGGMQVYTNGPTTTANAQCLSFLQNNNSASAQITYSNGTCNPFAGTTATAPTTGAIPTNALSYININCANTTSGADTCGIYGYTVKVILPIDSTWANPPNSQP
jgi:hypothetical protein